MSVVVIGSGGQLGWELCRQYGDEAVGLDQPDFDLTDQAEVVLRLTEIEPEAVINAAAYTHVDQAEEQPLQARAVNVEGVKYLAAACRALGCPLVHVSTDYVFSGDDGRTVPYRETDPPRPKGVYAQTKLEGEQRAAAWEKHIIVRTCGLYGRGGPQASGNFVKTMLRLSGTQDVLGIVADQHCTPSYVRDVARAIRYLTGTTAWGTYHVVNRGQTTWLDFAAEIFRLVRREVELRPITTEAYGAPAPRPRFSVLDTSRYDSMPNRPELPSWQSALADYLAAFRDELWMDE
ncbi:MAG: dTDP-4-dehydrorhamnose reductase [Pirellulales bacterium]|nr:dTDP-4-dehydrorhamnose reductase [Pirellulales bacterium]